MVRKATVKTLMDEAMVSVRVWRGMWERRYFRVDMEAVNKKPHPTRIASLLGN